MNGKFISLPTTTRACPGKEGSKITAMATDNEKGKLHTGNWTTQEKKNPSFGVASGQRRKPGRGGLREKKRIYPL